MFDPPIQVLIITVFFISTLIRSTFGFGNALMAMPLLVIMIGVQEAAPLVALVGLFIALIMVIRNWENMVWKDTFVLLISSLFGLPLGVLLISVVPENIVRWILGVILISFGLYYLTGIKLPVLRKSALAVPFGFAAGILGGAYNANGPPIVIYGVMRGWEKGAFRASLQGFFFISGLMIVAGHGLAGLWTEKFKRVIYIQIVLMGILMFV